MSVNLFSAFKSINEDKNWIKKTLVGGLLISICVLMSVFFEDKLPLLIIVDLLALGYAAGFIFSTMHSQINNKNCELAKWNEKNLLITGLKTLFALALLTFIFVFVTVLIGFVFKLVNIPEYVLYFASTVWLFVGILIFPVAFACYAKDLKISSIVNFKRFFVIAKENPRAMWTLFGCNVVYAVLYTIVKILLLAVDLTVFVVPFVYFYFWLVYANLVVQFANESAQEAVNFHVNEPVAPLEDTNSREVSDINDNRTFFEKYEFNAFRLVIAIAAWGILALTVYAIFVVPQGEAKISNRSLFILFFVIIPALIYVTKNIFTYKPLPKEQNQLHNEAQKQSNNEDGQE